jgi:SAM-dependent methyltransferase
VKEATMNNTDQIASWSGPQGQRWVEYQDAMDRALRPLGDAAMAVAKALRGERVLDVGCGCGDTTLALADRVGETGHVTGVDVSPPMLAHARQRAGARQNVTFEEADASTATGPHVDLIYSRFGVMFFADPRAAFVHLASRLADDGRIAFACWRSPPENEWVKLLGEAISPHVAAEPPPDPDAPGPFAFASRAKVEGILADAGLRDIRIEPLDAGLHWTRSPDLEIGVDLLSKIGPPSRRLNDVSDEVRARAIGAIRDALRPYQTPGGLVLGSASWIVTAHR